MTRRESDWSAASAELLQSAARYEPSDADCERVRSALARRLSEQAEAPTLSGDSVNVGVGLTTLTKRLLIGIGVACVVASAVVFMMAGRDDAGSQQPSAAKVERVGPPPEQGTPYPVVLDSAPVEEPARADVAVSARVETSQSQSPSPKKRRRTKLMAAPAAVEMPVAAEKPGASTLPEQVPTEPQRDSAVRVTKQPPTAATHAVLPNPESGATRASEETTTTSDPRAELVWLGKTNAALRESKLSTVLALCAEHERHWPQGMFVQEREALAAIAACRSTARDAEARAARFFRNYPQAPLRPRVEEACARQTAQRSPVAR